MRKLILFINFVCLCQVLFGQNTWEIYPHQINTPPKNTFQVLKNASEKPLEDVIGLPFEDIEQQVPNYGIVADTIWLKFTLRSMAAQELDWLLEIERTALVLLEIYIQDSAGKWVENKVGIFQNLQARPLKHHYTKLRGEEEIGRLAV